MKVYTCNDFVGHWPVGTSLVVVAENRTEARWLCIKELRRHQIKTFKSGDGKPARLLEVTLDAPMCRVLQDGEY